MRGLSIGEAQQSSASMTAESAARELLGLGGRKRAAPICDCCRGRQILAFDNKTPHGSARAMVLRENGSGVGFGAVRL